MIIARFVYSLAVAAGVLAGGISAAGAQDADAQRQACTPDAMRLCSEFIPDVERITACMTAKKAELSEPCRLAMYAGHEHHAARHHRGGRRHCGKHSRHCG